MKAKVIYLFLALCYFASNAQDYDYLGWVPDITSPIKTVRVRLHVIQDGSGNRNFSENNPLHVAYLQKLSEGINGIFANYAGGQQCGETNNIYDTRIRLQFLPVNYIKSDALFNYEIVGDDNCPGPTNWLDAYNEQWEASSSVKAINVYLHNPPACYQYYQSLNFVETFHRNAKDEPVSDQNEYCFNTLHSEGPAGGCAYFPSMDMAQNSYITMNALHLDYERKKASAVVSYRTGLRNPDLFWNENNPPYNDNNVYFWALSIAGNIVHEFGHCFRLYHDDMACCKTLMTTRSDSCTVGNGNYLRMDQLGAMHYSLTNMNVKKYVVEDRCNFNAAIPITITGTVNWNTARNLNSNVTVESGAVLNVNSSVAMAGGSTILVKPGGTLNINDNGVITRNCCSASGNLTFQIQGSMKVKYGGEFVLESRYAYQISGGNITLMAGATFTRLDNTLINASNGGTFTQNTGVISCSASITQNSLGVTSGTYLANGAIAVNNTIVSGISSSIRYSSNSEISITPTSPLHSYSGSNVLFEIGNNNCTPACSTQQYRKEEPIANTPCFFEDPVHKFASAHFQVDEPQKTLDIPKVYPNPVVAGSLHFGRQVERYVLSTQAGAVVRQGTKAEKMDLGDLPKGLYMIELDGKVEKVVIQ